MLDGPGGRDACARREPLLVSLERHAEPVVEDAEVAVAATHDRVRPDRLHLLRHHADIGAVAAGVAEAVEAEAIVEMAEQRDVVLERHIGAPAAAAAAAAATPATATEATTAAAAHGAAAARAAATAGDPATAATAADARAATIGLCAGTGPAAAGAGERGVTAAAAGRARTGLRAIASSAISRTGAITAARAISRAWAVAVAGAVTTARTVAVAGAGAAIAGTSTITAARPVTVARARTIPVACTRAVAITAARTITIAGTRTVAVAAGVEHLLAVLAAEILARALAGLDVVAGVFLAHLIVVVFHAVPVRGIVLEIPDIDVVDVAIDVDVVVAPVEAAAPVISARGPAADRVTGAERQPGRHHAGRDIAGRRPVVRRIGRIGPRTVDDGGIVVGHVDRIGLRRLDGDDLLVLLLADHDLLLLGRGQLVVGVRLRAQPLNRIHDVRLLRQHGVAELLRPVELRAHHGEHRRRRCELLEAVVPALLVDRGLELIALEILVLGGPAVGLHHLERIGRGDQHLRQQRIGIERDRRQQRVELFRFEQRLLGCGRRRGGGRLCGGRRLCQHHERNGCEQDDHDQSRQPSHHVRLLCDERAIDTIHSRAAGRAYCLLPWAPLCGCPFSSTRCHVLSGLKAVMRVAMRSVSGPRSFW